MTLPSYRVDGRDATEAGFYALACHPRISVVVEACAGAGKTWMLVSRVLRALLDGVQPRQILAITFTRKAAGEMRERLAQWLADFSAPHSTHGQRAEALVQRGLSPADAEALAPRLAELHETLLRGGDDVGMLTFHAWFAQLLAQAPLALLEQLGLPARHELVEDTSGLRDELMRRFHRRVQAEPTLRALYVALVQRHRRGTVLSWLAAAWAAAAELARADAAGTAQHSVPPASALYPAMAGRAHAGELLRSGPLADDAAQLARQLGEGPGSKRRTAATRLRAALDLADPEAALRTAWEALFTKEGPRHHLGDSPLRSSVQEGLAELRRMQCQQAAHTDHVAMLTLSRVLIDEYQLLKRQRGLVDMADLERAAEALLGDPAWAGWMQERLDQRVRQVLIDEFQDTNPTQWQLLQGWLSAYAGAGGGASGQQPPVLFIVGDPKQSIYRFRGAEPKVFDAARMFVADGLEGRLLACDHTRRSAPAVVDALNGVFADAAAVDGWGPFRAHSTGSAAAGQVLRLPGVPRSAREAAALKRSGWRDSLTEPRSEPDQVLRALEAAQVADAVCALLAQQRLAPGDVMVLARKRSMLALVAQALAEAGVPHVVAEPLLLHEAPEALDLAAVLDVLVSPRHDLSLARALKSPIFGASDADLLWLADLAAMRREAWLDALCGGTVPASAPLARARALLQRWRPRVTWLSPHDLLDRIVHEAEVIERLAAAVPPARRAAALHNVGAFLGAALAHEGGRFGSAYGLLRALRAGQLRAMAAAPAAAVQLLTVHGAKGLEARAVVVADCDPEKRPPDRAAVLVDWPLQHPAPRRVAFVRSETALAPSLQDAWDERQAAAAREELNGLYVAMTRAREWLVFSHTEPHQRQPGQRSWWARVQSVAQPWAPERPRMAPTAASTVEVPLPLALTQRPLPPAAATAVHDERRARLGRAVHRVLEWAAAAPQGLQDMRSAAQAAAASAGLDADATAEVQALAARVLDSPACSRFFDRAALRWAGNEVPLAWQGESLRIDRLVLLDDGWWVIDYKLALSPAAVQGLREQLRRYVAAVQALQPGDPVHGGFITGNGEWVQP